MGSYADTAAVTSEFKDITFSATTKVTDTEVDQFIDEVEAEINMILSTRYVTPVTSTEGIKILRRCTVILTKQIINNIFRVKTGNDKVNQELPTGGGPARCRKMLEKLADGTLTLPGATLVSAGSGLTDYNSNNNVTPTFDVTKEQW